MGKDKKKKKSLKLKSNKKRSKPKSRKKSLKSSGKSSRGTVVCKSKKSSKKSIKNKSTKAMPKSKPASKSQRRKSTGKKSKGSSKGKSSARSKDKSKSNKSKAPPKQYDAENGNQKTKRKEAHKKEDEYEYQYEYEENVDTNAEAPEKESSNSDSGTKKDKARQEKANKKGHKEAAEDETAEVTRAKSDDGYACASDDDSHLDTEEFMSAWKSAEDEEQQTAAKEPEEFTKPTVNQKVKDKGQLSVCFAEEIAASEFEALFDEIAELNGGVQTLRNSYGSIIKSLVAMHNRRAKKKMAKEGTSKELPKVNFMTTLSDITPKQAEQMEENLEVTDKYDLERFANPLTRDETFKMLFDEVEDLNQKTKRLRTEFFDEKNNFLPEKYERQTEYKLERKRFNHLRRWTKKLSTVVDQISRAYNDDLLNMFRLA